MASLDAIFFMDQFFSYNGKFFPAGTPVFSPSNRSFRFGDSLFETIRLNKGHLQLFDDHVKRLMQGMETLNLKVPTTFNKQFLDETIHKLAHKNNIGDFGRVRLTVFRKEGSFDDPIPCEAEWIIECNSLPDNYHRLNDGGYTIDISSNNRKGSGPLSNIKSGNYQVYILAAQRALELQVNECLVLNTEGRIADSSIFNVFLIRNQTIYTPSLSEAPVAGVIRQHLIRHFQRLGNPIHETELTIADLENAEKVFLTNALYGIRWVSSFRTSHYKNEMARKIYSDLFQQNISWVV